MAKKISKREAASVYSSIHADDVKIVAQQAFLDGMVFSDMIKAGVVTPDMIDVDFFVILRESNG